VLFRRRALGELSGAEQRIVARVRKSRQKEAAGAADAGLMQIECSEGEVLKFGGRWHGGDEKVDEQVGEGIDDCAWSDSGREVRSGSGARRTGVQRGEPCRAFELWASSFMWR
jgi:hypothetical protein